MISIYKQKREGVVVKVTHSDLLGAVVVITGSDTKYDGSTVMGFPERSVRVKLPLATASRS